MIFAFGEPVTVITRTISGHDALGNDTHTTSTTVCRGAFAPAGSIESVQGQDQVVIQDTVYLPPGVAITPTDQVVIDGITYDVDGSPNSYRNPFTGTEPGVVVKLKRVTG